MVSCASTLQSLSVSKLSLNQYLNYMTLGISCRKINMKVKDEVKQQIVSFYVEVFTSLHNTYK